MGTVLTEIARIVRDERVARGLSAVELASLANVRPERLEALEQGKPSVSTVDLDRLADTLELDPVALADGHRVEGISPAVFLRQASAGYQDFHPDDARVFARALAQGKVLFSLRDEEAKANLASFGTVEVVEGPDNATAKQGYDLAQRVRASLGRDNEPLEDMRALLEDQFGIAVVQAPLATKRLPAAAARCAGRQGAVVVLNANDEERQRNPLLDRVHLAHELCHILFDPKDTGVQLVIETEGKEDLLEQRARAFAAEFLVPSDSFAELLQGKDLATNAGARQAAIRIRERFRVPWEVTIRQLENHERVTKARAEELLAGGPGFYPRLVTKLPSAGQPSLGLCKALEHALDEAIITEGQARSLLNLAPGEPFPWERHGSAA